MGLSWDLKIADELLIFHLIAKMSAAPVQLTITAQWRFFARRNTVIEYQPMKIAVYPRVLRLSRFKELPNFQIVREVKAKSRQKSPSVCVYYEAGLIKRIHEYDVRSFRADPLYQKQLAPQRL